MVTGRAAGADGDRQAAHERAFAARYDRMTAPAERRWLGQRRRQLVGELAGDVLEVGAGTGANLAYYRAPHRLVLTEPSAAMRAQLAGALARFSVRAEVVDAPAERLPFSDGAFDTVVCALVLCTVDEPARALAEIRRVLAPGGRLRFIEHEGGGRLAGRAQDAVTPLVRHFAAGCRPNRDTLATMRAAGFAVSEVHTFRPWPRFPLVAPFVQGSAGPV